jgi:hypothetical protein
LNADDEIGGSLMDNRDRLKAEGGAADVNPTKSASRIDDRQPAQRNPLASTLTGPQSGSIRWIGADRRKGI